MKKATLLLLLFLYVSFGKAQQYTQYVAFDSIISGGLFVPESDCSDNFQCKITLDTSLYTYVTGLRFYVEIDSSWYPGPMASCPVHAGDTTFLDASHPNFSILTVPGLKVWYKFKLAGIPTIAGETYPCHLEQSACTCFCPVTYVLASNSDTSHCTVDLFNSVKEAANPKSIGIYPVPTSSSFSLKNNMGKSTVNIYNVYGELVLKTEAYNDIPVDISTLPNGIYSLYLTAKGSKSVSSKIIVAR